MGGGMEDTGSIGVLSSPRSLTDFSLAVVGCDCWYQYAAASLLAT